MIYKVRLLVLTCVLGRVGSSCNWDVSTQGCPSGGRTHPTWQCLAQQKNCPFTWAQVLATMPTFCLIGDRCENKPMYHCGKLQNGSWAERCAAGVGCRPGHVPVLPNEENGWATCSIPCRDPERYNNDNMFSAWDYRCSYAKRSCRADQHMHTCWNGSNTQNRRCTCDVRNGWILGNDWGSHRLFKYCFFFSDWWCQYSPCVDPETERLINWTCAAKCPTNYARLSYVHDECMWNGTTTTIATTTTTTTTITTSSTTTTTSTTITTSSTTTSTTPPSTPVLTCPPLSPPSTKPPHPSTSTSSSEQPVEAHTTVKSTDVPPAIFEATITVTSEDYPEDLDVNADIQDLPITRKLESAIQELMNKLPGKPRIRITSIKQGSLLVTFEIISDRVDTPEEINEVITEALVSGDMNGIGVSPDGFSFKEIKAEEPCKEETLIIGIVGGSVALLVTAGLVVLYMKKLRSVKYALETARLLTAVEDPDPVPMQTKKSLSSVFEIPTEEELEEEISEPLQKSLSVEFTQEKELSEHKLYYQDDSDLSFVSFTTLYDYRSGSEEGDSSLEESMK